MIVYEGIEKVMCGPLSTVMAQCKSYLIIEPGEMKKGTFERKVCELFDVPRGEVERILPPGGVKIAKKVSVVHTSKKLSAGNDIFTNHKYKFKQEELRLAFKFSIIHSE